MADKAQTWDVIVIGAGMGGGIATRVLAEAGLRVLVLEKGRAGYRAERTSITANALDPVARSVRSLWPGQIKARIDGRDSTFFGPIGAGIGGSSVFYAATLERPERQVFQPRKQAFAGYFQKFCDPHLWHKPEINHHCVSLPLSDLC